MVVWSIISSMPKTIADSRGARSEGPDFSIPSQWILQHYQTYVNQTLCQMPSHTFDISMLLSFPRNFFIGLDAVIKCVRAPRQIRSHWFNESAAATSLAFMQTVRMPASLSPISNDFAIFSVLPYVISKITIALIIWLVIWFCISKVKLYLLLHT